jgi:hypothetical protein
MSMDMVKKNIMVKGKTSTLVLKFHMENINIIKKSKLTDKEEE